MEFDISRCYSAINADELKPGDKVIVADTLKDLKSAVDTALYVYELTDILTESSEDRFFVNDRCYLLAYLVERKENCTNCVENGKVHGCIPMDDDKITRCFDYKPKTDKHYRPFRDTDELIKVWCEYKCPAHNHRERGLTMPFIWVRRKKANSKGQLITEFGDGWGVGVGRGEAYNMTDLLVHFTFLDGSPCGVEE